MVHVYSQKCVADWLERIADDLSAGTPKDGGAEESMCQERAMAALNTFELKLFSKTIGLANEVCTLVCVYLLFVYVSIFWLLYLFVLCICLLCVCVTWTWCVSFK
jgi:hypothetical protein